MSTQPAGSLAWMNLGTHDIDGAATFYGDLFGWDFADQGEDFGHCNMITNNGAPVGGAMSSLMGSEGPTEEPQNPTAWTVYLHSDDIEATLTKVTEQGGTIYYPAMAVGELGSMAIAGDPAGAAFGLWQPNQFAGFEFTGNHGSPVWFEVMVKDFDAALPFYRVALGWDIHAMGGEDNGEFRHITNGRDRAATAGLRDTSAWGDTPSYWRLYIGVNNTDESLEKFKELGGTVLDGPQESPFGRMATVQDPQGAAFQIIQIQG
ncbi:VOC family protein [Kocuria sp. cx-455]|uniref:VOC family protein n=1 Tax=Kocuria sp. cx-455 TaxID=2771377 RepID=UPI001689BB8D|nr:VOC family protein [Kocuria sp. cx-455]MBD2765763.1 VOC family protein [Kocuria sp. cx-455]